MVSNSTSNGNIFFVLSVNGMLGRGALAVIANLSRPMAAKMDELVLNVHGWINGQIEIAVARWYS